MSRLSAVKAVLSAKLDELQGRASAVERAMSTPSNSDWDDNAIESEDDEVLLKIGDVTINDIAEIQLALNRIESGHYGQCLTCGKAISQERLTALPFATRCIDCA